VPTPISHNFQNLCFARVRLNGAGLRVGDWELNAPENVNAAELGEVPVSGLMETASLYHRLSPGTVQPPLAALVFDVTRRFRALAHCFPIYNWLNSAQQLEFETLTQTISQHANFGLQLLGPQRRALTQQCPPSTRFIVAAHLAETFFFRQDILARLLSRPRHFLLYTTPEAYKADDGLAGGQYHSEREAIQLVWSRLFEGFYSPTPGVAPFLHEFGHLLDFFEPRTGYMRRESDGLLPGLRKTDGEIFTPRARELFLRGKQIELARYQAVLNGEASGVLPIGHPYVFQNDTEFCAGYFEMFFRNPHYMAALNPHLHNAYKTLLGYDAREVWEQDFDFYIIANREFYLSGQTPWPTHLTILSE
jgi:hypothetical protein